MLSLPDSRDTIIIFTFEPKRNVAAGTAHTENMIVGSKEEYELLMTAKEAMAFDEKE